MKLNIYVIYNIFVFSSVWPENTFTRQETSLHTRTLILNEKDEDVLVSLDTESHIDETKEKQKTKTFT